MGTSLLRLTRALVFTAVMTCVCTAMAAGPTLELTNNSDRTVMFVSQCAGGKERYESHAIKPGSSYTFSFSNTKDARLISAIVRKLHDKKAVALAVKIYDPYEMDDMNYAMSFNGNKVDGYTFGTPVSSGSDSSDSVSAPPPAPPASGG